MHSLTRYICMIAVLSIFSILILHVITDEEINESWTLDAERWKHSYISLEEMEKSWLNWFAERILWMDRYVYS